MNFFLASLILAVLSDSSLGWPGGAPGGTCVSLAPKVVPAGADAANTHGEGVTAQTTSVPYNLTIDKNTIGKGDQIAVTLKTATEAGKPFRGFLVVVVSAADTTNMKPYGDFDVNKNSDAKKLVCADSIGFAATHTNNTDKMATTLTWKAPGDAPDGAYLSRWTVVKELAVFWVNAAPVKFKIGKEEPSEIEAATGIYVNTWLSTAAIVLMYGLSAWR